MEKETKTIDKVLDFAGNAAKVAANLSETKKESPSPKMGDSDNSNKATTGSQNIQIHLDPTSRKKEPRPVEKHIHEYPDNRAMTDAECELALKKAQMEYELKKSDQLHSQVCQNREWEHKLEVEKKNEKKRKVRNIITCILAAAGIGYTSYTLWNDHKHNKNTATDQKKAPEKSNTETGGT